MATKTYTITPANGGEKAVLLDGWVVKGVFVDADHAKFGARICELLNREEAATATTGSTITTLEAAEQR